MKVCHNCEDRKVGCHGECERYLQEKKEHDEKKQVIRAQKIEQAIPLPTKLKPRHEKLRNQWSRNYGV